MKRIYARIRKPEEPERTPSSESVMGQPHTVEELLNKYGTYNIQPTSDSDNQFPQISQGLPRDARFRDK